MYYLKIFIATVFCIGLFSQTIHAQKKEASAEKTYEGLGYKASIPLYESKSNMSVDDMKKVATAYRLNNDTENAEFWYSQIMDKTSDPLDYFYYAQALQSNGRFDLAKENYLKYDEAVGSEDGADRRGKLLAEAIDRMKDFKHTETTIKNESLINTEKLDFSPTYYKDGIIFISSRGAQSVNNEEHRDLWIDDNFMALFSARRNQNGELSNVKEFSLDLTTKYHEGPICFSKDGQRIFFTRNDYVNEKRRNAKDGTMKLQIYTATKQGEHWSSPVELPFNTVENEEAHPALSPDGMKLYFSSDRSGGMGGMDLYVSEFKDGKWETPQNLGAKINTPGNEIFPFVHQDGTMYFASNGWGGLGGLDIFSTTFSQDSVWTKAENIGTPFNSKKDDFGFVLNVLKTEGYLTSDRKGGNGKDDIYSFTKPLDNLVKVKICAYDEESDARLSDVQFEVVEQFTNNSTASIDNDMVMTLEKISESNEYVLKLKNRGFDISKNDVIKMFSTDEEGGFNTHLKSDREYLLVATKDGYKIGEERIQGATLKGKSVYEFCVPMAKMNCMSFEGVVKNKKYGNTIPKAKVTLTNLCTGDNIEVVADKNGAFTFPCVPCGCDFVFKGEKINFKAGGSKQNTLGENCKLGTTLSTEIFLENDMKSMELIFEGVKVKEGAVIELENIYYDFNKYYIRDDAKNELDHVVKLLKIYPSMVIEIASHTDARASNKYNEKLSQNRAKAAVEYIVSRGISQSRLVAMGYGERQLKNGCADFVDCSEEEHQRNRRTEIKILKFDEKDVDVKYIDNMPQTIDAARLNRGFSWQ